MSHVTGLRKIISGGQTGVDQAALRAGKDRGLEIGGWCPPGRTSEEGVMPAEFPLRETPQERSPDAPHVPRSQRTEWNVRDSDGTLVIGPVEAATGVQWTIQCAQKFQRPLLLCGVDDPDAVRKIREWLRENRIATLNVAGPSEAAAPGIGQRACSLLRALLEKM